MRAKLSQIFSYKDVWIPLLFIIGITPWTPSLDLEISRYFYADQHFSTHPFYSWMFKFGVIPANILCGLAVITLGLSFFFPQWRKWRAAALAVIAAFAIGAGLVTHAILKDHWGRPRPRQVEEFGGKQAFRPYYSPNFFHQPEPSKSFPCGHCTTGFYFFILALLGRKYKNRTLFWTGLLLALCLGLALSLTRIAQGGHFFSDTLVAAYVMWLSAIVCVYFVPISQYQESDERINKAST